MRVFHYPPDVLDQLRTAWDTPGWHEPEPEPLPGTPVLQEILEVAYHASFTAEERRATKFSIVLCKPSETYGSLVFDRTRDFSVHEIMRLAPAGDVDADPIGIQIDATNRIQIWGLASHRSWAHPTFSVAAPGTVEVRRFSRIVFALAAGRSSPSAAVDVYFINSIFEVLATSLVEDFAARREPMGNAYSPYQFYGEVLMDLLHEAANYGHGATVFVVPDDAAPERLNSLFRVKYACRATPPLWPALRRAARKLVHGLSLPLEGEAGEDDATEEESEESGNNLAQWPRRVARLSRVDGGVLITDKYRLLGFGVEVIASAEELRTIHVADGAGEDIEQYGTRHRSAFRLCARWPEAVAFVCSQDGGIKCIRNCDGMVTLWK
jgi:hypothetical protein